MMITREEARVALNRLSNFSAPHGEVHFDTVHTYITQLEAENAALRGEVEQLKAPRAYTSMPPPRDIEPMPPPRLFGHLSTGKHGVYATRTSKDTD